MGIVQTMSFVIAGAILVGAWMVSRKLERIALEITAVRFLGEQIAETHGIPLHGYHDSLADLYGTLRTATGEIRRVTADRE